MGMAEYQSGEHAKYDIKYHFACLPMRDEPEQGDGFLETTTIAPGVN